MVPQEYLIHSYIRDKVGWQSMCIYYIYYIIIIHILSICSWLPLDYQSTMKTYSFIFTILVEGTCYSYWRHMNCKHSPQIIHYDNGVLCFMFEKQRWIFTIFLNVKCSATAKYHMFIMLLLLNSVFGCYWWGLIFYCVM